MNNYMSIYTDVLGNMMGIYALSSLLNLAFSVLFMLAIGYDCKAKNNDKKTMWMILAFFFPFISGIVYACTRNKNSVPQTMNCPNCGAFLDTSMQYCPNCNNTYFPAQEGVRAEAAKNSKNSKICFGVSVGVYVVSIILSAVMLSSIIPAALNAIDSEMDDTIGGINGLFDDDYYDDFEYDYNSHYGFDLNGRTVYYDRTGKVYSDADDVVYYDRNGSMYTYDADEYKFEAELGSTDYPAAYSYVDSEGYFVFDKAGAFDGQPTIVEDENDYTKLYDAKGNVYYYADMVSWDADGNMVDEYGQPIGNNK